MILALLLACAGAVERGEAALGADDLAGAEREFRAALDADPEDADALYGLGWTFQRAGETAAARDAFERLVRLHPEAPGGYRGLGSVQAAQGNLPAARRELERALALAPDDPAANQSLALVDLAEGHAEDALRRLEALGARGVTGSELEQARAAALSSLGRTDEAMEAAAHAVQLAEGARALTAARLTWVDTMLRHSDGRLDPAACATTAPLLREWYAAADRVLDQAQAGGALPAAVQDARRQVRRRRGSVEDRCVGGGK